MSQLQSQLHSQPQYHLPVGPYYPAAHEVGDILAAGVQFDAADLLALKNLSAEDELHDACDPGHVRRVGRLAFQLGLLAGLDMASARALQYAATLHDIGKRTVSQSILSKPGELTAEERHEIEGHAEAGARLLDGDAPHCKLAAEIARHHHEWWNGFGYPCGLVGRQTPLSARIVAIVDVFDALVSERPYKKGWKVAKALEYIETRAGTQFEPRLCLAFINFMHSQRANWHEFEAPETATRLEAALV